MRVRVWLGQGKEADRIQSVTVRGLAWRRRKQTGFGSVGDWVCLGSGREADQIESVGYRVSGEGKLIESVGYRVSGEGKQTRFSQWAFGFGWGVQGEQSAAGVRSLGGSGLAGKGKGSGLGLGVEGGSGRGRIQRAAR